jgi:AraC-like DNA-binding protein
MLPLDQAELVTMRSIFGILFNEFSEKSSFSEDMCRLYLRIILLKSRRLLHETIVESKVESPAAAQLTRRFKDILEEEFAERKRNGSHLRTPSDYAEKLCVHTNYLNASVKRATGKTSQEIIKDRVFQEAQILLKYTLLTTSEIADELGFKETTHFCSFFKKMASVTPLQFRRTNSVRYGETM